MAATWGHGGRGRKDWRMRRVLAVCLLTSVAMVLIFDGAQWYADNSALPRYCENPVDTVGYVREILSGDAVPEGASKRPYVVAAKLIFLVPRQDAEPLQSYLARLRVRISESCQISF